MRLVPLLSSPLSDEETEAGGGGPPRLALAGKLLTPCPTAMTLWPSQLVSAGLRLRHLGAVLSFQPVI